MKKFYSRLITFLVLFLGGSSLVPQAFAQTYNTTPQVWLPGTQFASGGGYVSAIAIDKNDNVYYAQYDGVSAYEIRKGSINTPNLSTSICQNLQFSASDFPRSIVVSSNGNVFFIEPNNAAVNNTVVKLDASNNYQKSTVRSTSYYTALALDAGNNLYTVELKTLSPEVYSIKKYLSGAENGTGTVQGSDIARTAGGSNTSTYPWGLAVDNSGNIYVTGFADATATDFLLKYPPGSNTASTVASAAQASNIGLFIDPNGNLFTTAWKNPATYTMHVLEYPGPTPAAATKVEVGTGIASDGGYGFAWGIAMDSRKNLYVTDGFNPSAAATNGRIVKYGAIGAVATVTTTAANPTGAAQITYQVVFDQSIAGISTSNFGVITTGSLPGAGIASVTGSGTTYTVTVNTGSSPGAGTIDLNLITTAGLSLQILNAGAANKVITIDRTPPNGNFTIPSYNNSGYTNNNPVILSISPDDATTMSFSVNGGAFTTPEAIATTKSITLTGSEGSSQQIAGRLIDALGNIQNISKSVIWDTVKPKITFTVVPPLFTNINSSTIQATVGTDLSTFQVSIDNGAYVQYTTVAGATLSYPTGVLADGNHKITVRGMDRSGNMGDPYSYSWTIDRTAPAMGTVTPPADGYYNLIGPNTSLVVKVKFSKTVNVTNGANPVYITASIGGVLKTMNYVSGTGTNELTFQYNIAGGDNGPVIYGLPVLVPAGSSITDLAGNVYIPPAAYVSPQPGEIVNTVNPSVILTTLAPATVIAPFTVHAQFSEAVTGFTASDLTLTNATADAPTSTDGIGYDILIHPLVTGNATVNLPANTVVNVANNPNTAAPAGITVFFDDQPAAVTSVTVPANGTYGIGQTMTFVVNYDKIVNITGTPQLPLTVGGTTHNMNYVSGSGSTALTFSYTVASGDLDLDGVVLGSSLLLNSGTIIGANTKAAGLTLNGVPATAAVLVDGIPPAVTAVIPPPDGVYNLVIPTMTFTVTLSKIVNVTGTPTLGLTIGSTVRTLSYISGTGTNTLTFQYIVAAPDNDMNGVVLGTAINLNGGTIKDAVGNDALLPLNGVGSTANVNVNTTQPSLTITMADPNPVNHNFAVTIVASEKLTGLTIGNITLSSGNVLGISTADNITYSAMVSPGAQGPGSVSIAANQLTGAISGNKNLASNTLLFNFDNIAPVVNSVVAPANGTYIIGQPLTFTINFSEPVTVNTATVPYLPLLIGSNTRQATYVSGSGGTALTFTYNVQEGDLAASGIQLPATLQNVTTIQDAAGNNANLTLVGVPALTGVLVDGVKPFISAVTNPANGIYNVNPANPLNFVVVFSEPIKLTGTVTLSINIGGTVRTMSTNTLYSANTLQFQYTVVDGDQDMDGIAYAGLDVSAATITDIAGNPATIDNSKFGAMPGVKVNTAHPTVTLTTAAGALINKPFTVTATFSEAVTGLLATGFSTTNCTVSNLATTDGIVYTFTVTPIANGAVGVSLPANKAVNIGLNGNTASNLISVTYDGTIPVVSSVTVPAAGTYKIGDVLNFVVNWSKVVTLDPTTNPYLQLTIGSTVKHADYVTGSGTNAYTFAYTVQEGDLDNNGITISQNTIQNVTAITDAATNVADLTLNNIGTLANVNVDGVKPFISTVTNPADGIYNVNPAVPLNFYVVFSEPVRITGTAKLSINIGGVIRTMSTNALYSPNSLQFQYKVVDGDQDMDGIEYAGMDLSAGTITDIPGNPAIIDNAKFGAMPGVKVNTAHPTVTLSTNAPNPTNHAFTVTAVFSEKVTGLTGNAFIFNTTVVRSNFNSTDGITYTLTAQAGITGPVKVSLPANAAFNIGNNGNKGSDTVTVNYDIEPPTVSFVTKPAVGTYKIGDKLIFVVHWSEVAILDPTTIPYIEFTIGSSTVHADYVTGSGTKAFTFTYTVKEGDLETTGITITKNTLQQVTSITDAATNQATTTMNILGQLTGVKVDGMKPFISTVTNPVDGVHSLNNLPLLKFDVVFSKPVTITGTAKLSIIIGTATKEMTGTLTGGNTLHFEYNILDGDQDLDGIAYAGLDLSAATIKDMAGNPATIDNSLFTAMPQVLVNTSHPTVVLSSAAPSLTNQPIPVTVVFSEAVTGLTVANFNVTNGTAGNLTTTDNITYHVTITPTADGVVTVALPANAAVNIGNNGTGASNMLSFTYDGTAPKVNSVTLPTANYYNEGAILQFVVHMSEPVVITGTPVLNFKIGSTAVTAAYTSGTQDLVFKYTVKAGDNGTADLTSATITVPVGTIKDPAGNPAVLTLVGIPAATGINVNTTHPTVVVVTTAATRVNTAINATITFSEAVTGLTVGELTVTNGTAVNLATTDNITYNVSIQPAADGNVTVMVPANVAQNIAGNGNVASNTLSFTFDATAPVITAATFNVSGDAPLNTSVGTLSASDASGILQNWTITNDPTNGAFTIDASGKITVNNIPALKKVAATTITLQVTVSDGLNTSQPASVTIVVGSLFVNKAPTMDPISDQAICADQTTHTLQLTSLSAVEADQTYTVSITSDQALFDVLSVTHDGLLTYKLKAAGATGVAHIIVTIKDNGGTINNGVDSLRRTFAITVNPTPVVTITSDKGTTVSKGDNIVLTATGGDTYAWDMAEGIVSGQQTAILHARVKTNTVYKVTASNIYDCSSAATIAVTANVDFKVDANNIMSPNGDGVNDRWVIKNIDSYPDNELKIYDRAGRLVYQRKNYNNEWDATTSGNPLSEGTYYYILTIQNGAKTTKGYITIVR